MTAWSLRGHCGHDISGYYATTVTTQPLPDSAVTAVHYADEKCYMFAAEQIHSKRNVRARFVAVDLGGSAMNWFRFDSLKAQDFDLASFSCLRNNEQRSEANRAIPGSHQVATGMKSDSAHRCPCENTAAAR